MTPEEIIKFIEERKNNPIFLQAIEETINKYKKINLNIYEHKINN